MAFEWVMAIGAFIFALLILSTLNTLNKNILLVIGQLDTLRDRLDSVNVNLREIENNGS